MSGLFFFSVDSMYYHFVLSLIVALRARDHYTIVFLGVYKGTQLRGKKEGKNKPLYLLLLQWITSYI